MTPAHGCHRSVNGQGKKIFKVREMSGNFILGQGKLAFLRKVRENWSRMGAKDCCNRRLEATTISEILHLFGQGNLTFIREKSRNFENWCLWQPCKQICNWCKQVLVTSCKLLRQIANQNLNLVMVEFWSSSLKSRIAQWLSIWTSDWSLVRFRGDGSY